MEVDAEWRRALGSCVKLANIRAEDKIWIHVTDDEKAKENFDRALKIQNSSCYEVRLKNDSGIS